MACGLPVIATRHSGFPEQVIDRTTGFLVLEGDWRALACTISHLIDHPDLWAPMGRSGRERVQMKYDSERILDEQVKIYDSLLAEQR